MQHLLFSVYYSISRQLLRYWSCLLLIVAITRFSFMSLFFCTFQIMLAPKSCILVGVCFSPSSIGEENHHGKISFKCSQVDTSNTSAVSCKSAYPLLIHVKSTQSTAKRFNILYKWQSGKVFTLAWYDNLPPFCYACVYCVSVVL